MMPTILQPWKTGSGSLAAIAARRRKAMIGPRPGTNPIKNTRLERAGFKKLNETAFRLAHADESYRRAVSLPD